MNLIYWGSSIFQLFCLILSFTHDMKWITVGLLTFTLRNINAYFDFELRKDIIGQKAWTMIIIFQTATTLFNMIMLNNIMDRFFLPISILLGFLTYSGMIIAIYDTLSLQVDEKNTFVSTMFFATLIIAIQLYIQKRVHKEVFLEQKQRIAQQTEFQTIFNQLDEGILITSENKVTEINTAFKKFVSRYFDNPTMKKVSLCSKVIEESESMKVNNKNKKWSDKCFNCFNFFFCWRQNSKTNKVLSENDKVSIARAEMKVLNTKIFKVHLK